MDIDEALNVEELRGRALEHTRLAYRLLPPLKQPRILDIGCGEGLQTMELARLGEGEVVGIDTDQDALSRLRQRIDEAGLGARIKAIQVSLFDNRFGDNSFDVLWGEGVFHLLDACRSLSECQRLLKPHGYLVMHQTIVWFESVRKRLPEFGFEFMTQHMLPKHFWWTDYGALLEGRILAYRETYSDASDSPKLAEHESLIADIKSDPEGTASGIYLMQKGD